MGSWFGHVFPAVYCCIVALILILYTWRSRDNVVEALTGTKRFRFIIAACAIVISVAGFTIEAVGGVLFNGYPFFQSAHETIYVGIFMMGVMTLLESRGHMPADSWRFGLGVAFFVEGLVFYGHMLEQEGIERDVHFIQVVLAWFDSASFFLACLYRTSMLPHVLGTVSLFGQGIWFYVIAVIVYTDAYANVMIMPATVYTLAGLVFVFIFSFAGFLQIRVSQPYEAEQEALDLLITTGKEGKYVPVTAENVV